jgi:hypothetical protein
VVDGTLDEAACVRMLFVFSGDCDQELSAADLAPAVERVKAMAPIIPE